LCLLPLSYLLLTSILYLSHFYFFFFFYSYGDHRDLHSFPTRRSSDLRGRGAVHVTIAAQDECHLAIAKPRRGFRDRLKHRLQIEDRKSTRLNSSHDQISYAVFCLKKKKKKKKQKKKKKKKIQYKNIKK